MLSNISTASSNWGRALRLAALAIGGVALMLALQPQHARAMAGFCDVGAQCFDPIGGFGVCNGNSSACYCGSVQDQGQDDCNIIE